MNYLIAHLGKPTTLYREQVKLYLLQIKDPTGENLNPAQEDAEKKVIINKNSIL